MATFKKQNRIETVSEGFHMRIMKTTHNEKKRNSDHLGERRKEGYIIIKADENTHNLMLSVGMK
jgi:hypothetical protein